MRCPYCVSEIADEALACPRCTRDLYLFKPLLEKIGQLEKTVAEQAKAAAANSEARIAALEQELAAIKAERAGTAEAAAALVDAVEQETPAAPAPSGYAAAAAQSLIPTLLLLVLAHWVMLFVYDVKPLYLRVATILIPVPFGFLLAAQFPNEFRKSVLAAAALAFAGVFSMLTVTALIDKVPLLPQDLRDLRETLEYVLSIALAFVTGLLLGEYHARKKLAELRTNRVVLLLARAFVPNEEGKLGIEKAVKKLTKLHDAVMPAATGAASIYAGIKAFLGNMG
jgi:hypothetical protein